MIEKLLRYQDGINEIRLVRPVPVMTALNFSSDDMAEGLIPLTVHQLNFNIPFLLISANKLSDIITPAQETCVGTVTFSDRFQAFQPPFLGEDP